MGTPEAAAATLEQLLTGPDPVIGVVTQPDRPAGRDRKMVSSPVRRFAEKAHIPVVAPEKIRDPDFMSTLQRWSPKIIVVVAYGRILPRAVLELPTQGCVNVHYSLLPKYRGAAPAAWTIMNGEEKSGVTTMKLVEKMDAGPIYLQNEVPVAPDETAGSLQAKLTPTGASLLIETLQRLKQGSLTPQSQNEAEVSFAPILKKEHGLINWHEPAVVLERRVRGLNPWPSAYTHWRGQLLKIHRAKVVVKDHRATPGEIIRADRGGFWVATGSDILSLEEVQLENRKRLPSVEFLRGARIETGDHF
ncbi:MAG TPA: methionyl-tRNA formyltransferase [Candidatus Binatia bacterium]|nr:methionyl-tRNA formyltransferase [Candidatus Binatia bacterium]